MMHYDWSDLAFASKKPLDQLRATFIAAPRELSPARFKQLVKTYLPQGNILLGLAKESYVADLEDQPQFRMLESHTIQPIVDQVNASTNKFKITILSYFQRDLPHLLEKLDLARAVFINGSWYHAFHLRPEYYTLVNRHIPYELVTPFASEAEAKTYADAHQPASPAINPAARYTAAQMLEFAATAARGSFASSEHQTGVALGRGLTGGTYELLTTAFNRVVPYQTYAMHHGSTRERHFSPPNDLNHYDANHAEMELLTRALHNGLDLRGTTLFINLLPCPTCARVLSATDIAQVIYALDHSAGYAANLFQAAGKTIQQLTPGT